MSLREIFQGCTKHPSHFPRPTLLLTSFMAQQEISNRYKGWKKDSVLISKCSAHTNSGKLNNKNNAFFSSLFGTFASSALHIPTTPTTPVVHGTFLEQLTYHCTRTEQNEKLTFAGLPGFFSDSTVPLDYSVRRYARSNLNSQTSTFV